MSDVEPGERRRKRDGRKIKKLARKLDKIWERNANYTARNVRLEMFETRRRLDGIADELLEVDDE